MEVLEVYDGQYKARAMPECCWACKLQKIGGTTFLGDCRWFESRGEAAKPITPAVVDRGCKFWAVGRGVREPEPAQESLL